MLLTQARQIDEVEETSLLTASAKGLLPTTNTVLRLTSGCAASRNHCA